MASRQQGLSDATSAGRCGWFKKNAGNRSLGLNTCGINGVTIFAPGRDGRQLGEPAMGGIGADVTMRTVHNSWTGRTVELTCDGQKQTVDLRTTLPGPLFTAHGERWGFNFMVKSSPVELESLTDDRVVTALGLIADPPQVSLGRHRETPYIIISSEPAESLEIITHEHWWFTFRRPGARIMIVPLLSAADAPRTPEKIGLWKDLIAAPPARVDETFEVDDDVLTIHASVTTAEGDPVKCCPLPPMAALWGSIEGACGAMQSMAAAEPLLCTLLGPYGVLPGASSYERRIRMDWIRARMEFTRPLSGELAPIPDELAFAGDASWDESCPMDSLMSHRVWSPLAKMLGPEMWEPIRERIPIPTPEAFRDSLMSYTEPATGRSWSKDKTVFDYRGEISYDNNWYNGLTLSGLARAADCEDGKVASSARELAKAIKPERAAMIAYTEIYSDWALDAAWSDARGEIQDLDCAHNDLDGLLGEGRLREIEGDGDGRDFCVYLAGRIAVNSLAIYELARDYYRRGFNWYAGAAPEVVNEEDVYGIRNLRERYFGEIIGGSSRGPITSPPNFPEFAALLKCYGPVERFRKMADDWREMHAERYSDWLAFGIGPQRAEKMRAGGKLDLEADHGLREQLAVFYHTSLDVAVRLLVLDEPPDAVEALFAHPLSLADQLMCRAGARLRIEGVESRI